MRGTLDAKGRRANLQLIIDNDDQFLLRPRNHDTDNLRAILHLGEGR
jgi:hypothetical protein